MARPLVSIIITNFNYASFLPQCVDSALRQSYTNIEVVVVDDGSTDDSLEVLNRFGERVRTVVQANQGQHAAFMAGLRSSKGDIICLLDADDYWAPGKVQRVVDVFEAEPRVSWVRHKLLLVDAGGASLHSQIPIFRGSRVEKLDAAAVAERVIMAPTSAIALRRDLAGRALKGESVRYDADAFLLAACAAVGAVGYSLDEVLGSYRRHGGQQYTSAGDMQRMFERQVEVGTAIARVLNRGEPVSNYKHRLITQSLSGYSMAHPRRLGTLGMALFSATRLFTRPRLLLRQVASVMVAGFAPGWWLTRFRQRGDYK